MSQAMTFTVLLVCAGNICRSPMAERLGRAYLEEALGDAASLIRVGSAGTRAVAGASMHPHSALVLRGFGGDPDGFTAQQLEEGMVREADVVLTMSGAHRKDVLALAPRALHRTFTLSEAADLIGLLGDVDHSEETLPDRARALVREMAIGRSRRRGEADDDVPDPVDGPLEAHQEAAEVIVTTLLPLLRRIAALS